MGKIILIGGNLDKGKGLARKNIRVEGMKLVHPQILERLLLEMDGRDSKIEIITTATRIPKQVGSEYKKAFARLESRNIGLMHLTGPQQADEKKYLKRLNECDGLMFTGGDQVLICSALLKTKFLARMKERFRTEKNFLIAGTSAGAMALPKIMIARGDTTEALRKGRVKLSEGLGLLSGIIIDSHFIQRGRFTRLIEAVSANPKKLGIGLGENTAVYLKQPQMVETIGSNLVVLIDGSHLSYNNINDIKDGDLICVEDMKLHVLPKGHKFNIPKRKIYNK